MTLTPKTLTGDLTDEFRDRVQSFLDTALTDELRAAGRRTTGVHSEMWASREWHHRLYARGWAAPAWPQAFGGTGWSAPQRLYFDRALADNDAPILSASGIRALGPLLIDQGDPDLIARYIPGTLSGALVWCQGFSEPGAGSDLAALSTRAIPNGDHYVVQGAKIWTTGAHHADHMFCLARSSRDGPPWAGMTFLLVPMNSPGISITPIRMINGDTEFAEVRFDNVIVPATDRVGPEGEGWAVAKRLMRFARANNTTSSILRRAWRAALSRTSAAGLDGDPSRRAAGAQIAIRMQAFEALELRLLQAGTLDGEDDSGPSALKLLASELHQAITELALDAAGPAAAVMTQSDDMAGSACPAGGNWVPEHTMSKYLATRAASIYSGTSETHKNLIARKIMGPMRPPPGYT